MRAWAEAIIFALAAVLVLLAVGAFDDDERTDE